MNKEIFYCSLDQFDSSNAIINNWVNAKKDSDIQLEIKNLQLPLINFDRFKGSFLRLKNKTVLELNAGTKDFLFFKDVLTLNFFFNASVISNSGNDTVLFECTVDEFVIRFYFKKDIQNSRAQIYFNCSRKDDNEGAESEISDDLYTGIEINEDYWYNLNLNMDSKGILDFSIIYINSLLNASAKSADDTAGSFELDLNDILQEKINFRKIHSAVFGSADNLAELAVSDLYFFRNISEDELGDYIEKGVNVSSKYTYRSKISFDLSTLYNGYEYKGIQIFDRKNERYFLKLLLHNYSIAKRDENSQIILRLKKGFFKIAPQKNKNIKIKERGDEFFVEFDISDSQLEYELPEIKMVNLTNSENIFMQCEITGITVFENNNPVEICDRLFMDSLIPFRDLSRKSTVPFEAAVLGNQPFEINESGENIFHINLMNISETELVFQHNEAIGLKGRLKLKSRFWKLLVPQDSVNTIKIDSKIIDNNKNSIKILKEFTFKYDRSEDEIYLETNNAVTIQPQENIRLQISGLRLNPFSEIIPEGSYPFSFRFENIADYNDGEIPFSLNLKSKSQPVPAGSIIAFYGNTIPEGWLLCDGQKIDEKKYPELFKNLGQNVPDLRNKFLAGAGLAYSLSETGGTDTVTLDSKEMPSHSHQVKGIKSHNSPFKDGVDLGWGRVESLVGGLYGSDRNNGSGDYFFTKNNSPIVSEGKGEAHENRPPYHAVYYIIKAH